MHFYQNRPEKTVYYAIQALQSLGFVVKGSELSRLFGTPLTVEIWGMVTEHVVDCWITLSHPYRSVAPELVSQAEEYARISYKICVGDDETFDKTIEQTSA